MRSTRDIKRKIGSVRNIEKICRAMKTVSSMKALKAGERNRSAHPYSDALANLAARLIPAGHVHPLTEVRGVYSSLIVAISADKGLAGSYNSKVIREAQKLILERKQVQTIPIGRKVAEAFRRLKFDVESVVSPLGANPPYSVFAALADHIGLLYTQKVWDEVYLVHTVPGGGVIADRILPIVPQARKPEKASEELLFEPAIQEIISEMLPRCLRTLLYKAVLASVAAEHLARTSAMALATDNTQKLVAHLTVEYNKSRQANITRELSDIIGAAEALR
jgi:F-type H+-transporting ATPase subunit gamma